MKKGKQGEGGGQPLKWSSPEELEQKINEYFEWAKENKKHITVSGLAWWLRTDRITLINYENSDENGWLSRLDDNTKRKYINTIKEAKQRIQSEYEESLFYRGSVTGAIFTLKNNYGWADKQEIEHTNRTITIGIDEE